MHETIVITKDGHEYRGYIWAVVVGEDGWFDLSSGEDMIRFRMDQCRSVTTKDERVSINRVGVTVDQLAQWAQWKEEAEHAEQETVDGDEGERREAPGGA